MSRPSSNSPPLAESALVPTLELKRTAGMTRGVMPAHDRPPPIGPTRVPRSIQLLSLVALATTAAWAMWPAPRPPQAEPTTIQPETAKSRAPSTTPSASLDLDAFRVPIWVTPPSPPPAPPAIASPTLPPLRLQLIAITRGGTTGDPVGPGAPPTPTPTPTPHPSASIELRATLYDPDTDRLWIVASGEKIGERTVERVNPHEIEIVGADGRRVLTLADGGVGGGPR